MMPLKNSSQIVIIVKRDMSSFTITFGDQAENHKGMQIIGKPAEEGYSLKDIQQAKESFEKKGYKA